MPKMNVNDKMQVLNPGKQAYYGRHNLKEDNSSLKICSIFLFISFMFSIYQSSNERQDQSLAGALSRLQYYAPRGR